MLKVALAALVLGLGGGVARTAAPVQLYGVVGPDAENRITLSRADGSPVRTLKPGTYLIHVDDQARIHNFHLWGAGVDRATSVEFVGTQTWKVRLTRGRYHVVCDPHAQVMALVFRVPVVRKKHPHR